MRLSKTTLIVAIVILLATVASMSIYIGVNSGTHEKLIEQAEYISHLEEENTRIDFAYTTALIKIDDLKQVIASKDELILELKVKGQVLELAKETIETSLLYIKVLQLKMDHVGLSYPEFIVDTILEDGYFESVEDQVDYFKGIEE